MTRLVGPQLAIVGMACCYPEARTPGELWENALAQRRAFRRIPAERLSLDDYLTSDRAAPDRTYASEAAVIEGYEFDRVRFRVAGTTFRAADLAHWLALDIAAQALADAGFAEGEGLPKATTGVLLGNTLTGEFARANGLRLRWPYVRRVLEAALAEQGQPSEQRSTFLQNLETQFKAPFPPIGEESLAGGLSNTIAGRICNYFDLHGGGYTVDGACASSLLAVTHACSALVAGDLDVAIAGGVDLSLDPFELVGFAKTGALATEEMRVYDTRSAGFWPGEGCGFVVLMRHADAVAQRRRIYAVIRGWGISSDGGGGITRPEVEGQLLAIQRAYQRAGFGIDTVTYFEGHGTGTAVGDATELRALALARREAASMAEPTQSNIEPAVISSIKANIGHTKAAAGVAGLIKAVMAVHTQILPPTTGCQTPHPVLSDESSTLRVLSQAEPWPAELPLRAGASAMGFGGINAHVVLEGVVSERRAALGSHEQLLCASAQDTELFLLGAPDIADLLRQVAHLLSLAPRLSWAEMADLAAELQRSLAHTGARAAVVAVTPAALAERLQTLQTWLRAGITTQLDLSIGVFLGLGAHTPRLGFLFPGQGTQVYENGGALARRFAFIQDLYTSTFLASQSGDFPGPCRPGGSLDPVLSTALAQPAIVSAELAALRVLDRLALRAHVAVGHSLGELSALYWAGALDEAALLRIASIRGRLMATLDGPAGAMAHIGADASAVIGLLNGSTQEMVTIACLNSPTRTVIAGVATAVETVMRRAQASGWSAGPIPVSHAFHSPLMAAAVQPLVDYLVTEAWRPLQRSVVSTITGDLLTSDTNLSTLLEQQVTAPVRFTEAVTKASAGVDLLIEVGPGRVLSGLAQEWLDTPVIALDVGGPSLQGLLLAAGAAYALGAPLNHAALFTDRFTRPFNLAWHPRFFVNPCELAPAVPSPQSTVLSSQSFDDKLSAQDSPTQDSPTQDYKSLVRQLVAERAELPLAAVRDDDRLLSELHLNSISVSQLVVEAARRLGLPPSLAPTEYADMTVAAVAQALAERSRTAGATALDEEQHLAAGVAAWVRAFTVELVERPQPQCQLPTVPGAWQVIGPPAHALAAPLQQAFSDALGQGVVICLPPQPDECHLGLLLEGVRTLFALEKSHAEARFVLVQHGVGAAALARTLHLETPSITTCVIDVPVDHPQAVAWIVAEAMAATGYSEVHYDAAGRRCEPVLRLLPLAPEDADHKMSRGQGDKLIVPSPHPVSPSPLPLGSDDVLLVTGGGKGITAECALALARTSGARLALLGRSQAESDAELATNLARLRSAGVEFCYFVADVTQADEVRAAVREAERLLGPVTGILHGAARNVPQLLRALDEDAFQQTLAPKLQGLRNLLAVVNPRPEDSRLRLLVTFGSIIARTGLPGEADYGLANEWLTAFTAQFQRQHPTCRCLAVEWSVWAGAGMGDRLGRLDALLNQGITPIPLDEGVAMLQRLFAQLGQADAAPLPSAVVVTGRFGAPPTLRVEQAELPFWRFLETTRVHYPGVELVVDATLAADSDPYLTDHVWRGERLLPAVIGLEAMAQAALALVAPDKGLKEPPILEEVRFERPVVVPADTNVTIRLAALLREPGLVEVVLRSNATAFQVNHFRATCRFGVGDEPDVTGLRKSVTSLSPNHHEFPLLDLDPQRDLYGEILFQGGRFQRLQQYRYVAATACVAEITPAAATWFGRYLPPDLVLGDPGMRDATIHAIQVCVPQATLLPIGVERLTPGAASTPGPRIVHAYERARQGDIFIYDVTVTNADGELQEDWQGLQLRMVGSADGARPWPAPLLGPILERRLSELLPSAVVHIAVERDPTGAPRRQRSDSAIQRALGQVIPIQRRLDGKPEVAGNQVVAAAHAGDLTLALAAPGPIGCDVEPVAARTKVVWQDLLGPQRYRLAEVIAQTTGEDVDTAATRVWSAGECMKKAGAVLHAPLVLDSTHPDGWILLSSGALWAATVVTQVHDIPDRLVLAVVVRSNHARL